MMIDNHYAHTETVQVPRHSDRAVQWDTAVQDDAHCAPLDLPLSAALPFLALLPRM